MSDHKDTINSQTVMSKCIVWSLEEYRQLKTVTSTDYYAVRLELAAPCLLHAPSPTMHPLPIRRWL